MAFFATTLPAGIPAGTAAPVTLPHQFVTLPDGSQAVGDLVQRGDGTFAFATGNYAGLTLNAQRQPDPQSLTLVQSVQKAQSQPGGLSPGSYSVNPDGTLTIIDSSIAAPGTTIAKNGAYLNPDGTPYVGAGTEPRWAVRQPDGQPATADPNFKGSDGGLITNLVTKDNPIAGTLNTVGDIASGNGKQAASDFGAGVSGGTLPQVDSNGNIVPGDTTKAVATDAGVPPGVPGVTSPVTGPGGVADEMGKLVSGLGLNLGGSGSLGTGAATDQAARDNALADALSAERLNGTNAGQALANQLAAEKAGPNAGYDLANQIAGQLQQPTQGSILAQQYAQQLAAGQTGDQLAAQLAAQRAGPQQGDLTAQQIAAQLQQPTAGAQLAGQLDAQRLGPQAGDALATQLAAQLKQPTTGAQQAAQFAGQRAAPQAGDLLAAQLGQQLQAPTQGAIDAAKLAAQRNGTQAGDVLAAQLNAQRLGPQTGDVLAGQLGQQAATAGVLANQTRGQSQDVYGQQMQSIAGLRDAANGVVPSAAELQAQRQANVDASRQFGIAAALQGSNPGAALRQALQGSAQIAGDEGANAAILRATEQANARNALAQALSGVQGQVQNNTQLNLGQQSTALQGQTTAAGQAAQERASLLSGQATATGQAQNERAALLSGQTTSSGQGVQQTANLLQAQGTAAGQAEAARQALLGAQTTATGQGVQETGQLLGAQTAATGQAAAERAALLSGENAAGSQGVTQQGNLLQSLNTSQGQAATERANLLQGQTTATGQAATERGNLLSGETAATGQGVQQQANLLQAQSAATGQGASIQNNLTNAQTTATGQGLNQDQALLNAQTTSQGQAGTAIGTALTAQAAQNAANAQETGAIVGGLGAGITTLLTKSDKRAKEDVEPVELANALADALLRRGSAPPRAAKSLPESMADDLGDHVRGVTFVYKPGEAGGDPAQHFGLMAQQLEKVIPGVVRRDERGMRVVDTGHLTMGNTAMIAEMANRVRELEEGRGKKRSAS